MRRLEYSVFVAEVGARCEARTTYKSWHKSLTMSPNMFSATNTE